MSSAEGVGAGPVAVGLPEPWEPPRVANASAAMSSTKTPTTVTSVREDRAGGRRAAAGPLSGSRVRVVPVGPSSGSRWLG